MKPHIQPVDLNRYAGTWYEIARFPHRFERNLTGVTATYTLMPNGKIRVENKGFKNSLDGPVSKAIGKAKPAADPAVGHLRVSFFWIFYADYFILGLDQENYQWALVGSSSPNFLWILSRKPQMEQQQLERLIQRAAELGYDVSKLEMVPQPVL
ncbi:MAG: lipocalin family protein [Bacteroidetes bacterium]|nr:lipocalin family protein [Bacteroidota bacterium]